MCPSGRPSIPTLLTLAATKVSGQECYEEGNLNMISQPPTFGFVSYPAMPSCFLCYLGLNKYQHLLSNSLFMLRWK